ncbi:MAG: hypothetical protein AAF567_15145 [Actinomycetota bacterium]
MAWIDDQGITQDGEPPAGYWNIGGRWYSVDAITRDHQPASRRERQLAQLLTG